MNSSIEARPDRRDRQWALGLFMLALVPRLIHLLLVREAPPFRILYIDPLMYDEWAQRIAGGQLMSDRPFFLDPLYPYFLAVIYAVFGHHYEAVVAIQSVLGALVAPLVFLSTLRWLERPVAITAGLIAALYVPGIYFGSLVMKPGLSVFLVALVMWLLSRLLAERRPVMHWVLAGVVLGLAILTRGNLLLTVPVILAWLVAGRGSGPGSELRDVQFRQRLRDRTRWLETGGLLAGTLLVLLLPATHNAIVGSQFILTSANAGANFYIGNNPVHQTGQYEQLAFVRPNPKYEQVDFEREAEHRAGRELTDREISAFWFAESGKWIREEPLAWLHLMWKKVKRFWGSYEIPDSVDYYLYREHAPVLRLPFPGFGLLAPLGLLGAVFAWSRPGWPRLLVVFVLTYSMTVIVFFVFSRFRMVNAPALYVFAALAGHELWHRWRVFRRQPASRRRAWVAAGLFVAFFLFVNVPLRARIDTVGFKVADAIGWPTIPETSMLGHFNLGVAAAREARDSDGADEMLALAESELRLAIELDLHRKYARSHVELGKVLARVGKNREAIEIYREAATIEPDDFQIYHALGLLHRREGDLQNAGPAFQKALEIQPRHAPSATALGEVLLELGHAPEAARAFSHALQLDPRNARAAEGLRRAQAGS